MGEPPADHQHDPTRRARERAAREPCSLGRAVLLAYAFVFLVVLIGVSLVVVLAVLP